MTHIRCLAMSAILGLALSVGWAQAQVAGHDCDAERQVPAGMHSERTYNQLARVYEDIGEEKYDEAFEALRTLARRRLSAFERATVMQAMGFVRARQERWAEAIEHFDEAIELDRLPNAQHFEMILQTAQIYNIMERYDDALDRLDLWFCVVSEEQARQVPQVWVLRANLMLQKQDYREALASIERAIRLSEEPRESWYQLKLSIHFELEDYREAVEVLKTLIGMRPERKDYWVQMASAYMGLDNEAEAMASLRMAWRKGLLERESEFVQLAGLIQSLGAPRQAAEVIEDGIARGIVEENRRNWEMTAGAWYQAREIDKALDAYERAGAHSEDGRIDLQRGHILINEERWSRALDALELALAKGGLSETEIGNAHLLAGMAHYNLGNYEAAEQAFNNAANYGRLRSAAREWLRHIRQERA